MPAHAATMNLDGRYSSKIHTELMRRYLFTVATALWLGGFTFYSTVVIHTGHRVLGGLLEVGFVTQRVTSWLNLIGVVALLVLLWLVIVTWCGPCVNMGE